MEEEATEVEGVADVEVAVEEAGVGAAERKNIRMHNYEPRRRRCRSANPQFSVSIAENPSCGLRTGMRGWSKLNGEEISNSLYYAGWGAYS